MYCVRQKRNNEVLFKINQLTIFLVLIFQEMFCVSGNSLATTNEGLFDDLQSLVDSVNNIKLGHEHVNTDRQNATLYIGYSNNPFGPSIKYRNHNNNKNMLPSHQNGLTTVQHNDLQNFDFVTTNLDNSLDQKSNSQISSEEIRSKRGVTQLYNMIICATGCDPWKYKGYGCYCGFLGAGHPVDGIDSCCRSHDNCYGASDCHGFQAYYVPYLWQCHRHQPFCAYEEGSCARRLCECDRRLSQCLSRYPCPNTQALCLSSVWRLFQNILMIL